MYGKVDSLELDLEAQKVLTEQHCQRAKNLNEELERSSVQCTALTHAKAAVEQLNQRLGEELADLTRANFELSESLTVCREDNTRLMMNVDQLGEQVLCPSTLLVQYGYYSTSYYKYCTA